MLSVRHLDAPRCSRQRTTAQLVHVTVIDHLYQTIRFRLQEASHVLSVRFGHAAVVSKVVGNVNGNDANEHPIEGHRFEDLKLWYEYE